jgi:hypothetical protein
VDDNVRLLFFPFLFANFTISLFQTDSRTGNRRRHTFPAQNASSSAALPVDSPVTVLSENVCPHDPPPPRSFRLTPFFSLALSRRQTARLTVASAEPIASPSIALPYDRRVDDNVRLLFIR